MTLSKEELRQRLWAYRQQNWNKVQTDEWQKKIVDQQMSFDASGFLENIIRRFDMSPGGIRYLDIGSGIGDYVIAARKMGIKAYGIEPDLIGVGSIESSLKIARDRADNPRVFFSGVGEKLPFSDAQFDLITMNQVLEHVQDLRAVLVEAIRVLKPGGVLLFSSPNYLSFYEPHYKVFWVPLFPRPLANLYLRLRGRTPKFLEGINYLTRNKLNGLLQSLPCQFEDDQFAYLNKRMGEIDAIHSKILRSGAKVVRAIGIDQLTIWLYINFRIRGLSYVVIKDSSD